MSTSEALRESLSALMDGEASEMDLARVLKAVETDPEARELWRRMQQARTILRREPTEGSAVDVSAAVQSALKNQRRSNPWVGLAVAASVTLAVVLGGQQMLQQETGVPAIQVPGAVVGFQNGAAVQASFGQNQRAQSSRETSLERVESTVNPYEQIAREQFSRFGQIHAQATAPLQPSPLVPFIRAQEPQQP